MYPLTSSWNHLVRRGLQKLLRPQEYQLIHFLWELSFEISVQLKLTGRMILPGFANSHGIQKQWTRMRDSWKSTRIYKVHSHVHSAMARAIRRHGVKIMESVIIAMVTVLSMRMHIGLGSHPRFQNLHATQQTDWKALILPG